jgi:hypothetical protein
MSKITQINRKKKLPEVVDLDTGELIKNAYSLEDTNSVEISYEEYVIMSSEAVQYIKKVLKAHEKAYLMEMFDMLKTPLNMLYTKNNRPHTNKSLQQDLNHTKTAFYALMNKLHKAGIIWYLTGYDEGKKVKRIIVNPHIARKRKVFDREILAFFNDIKTLQKDSEYLNSNSSLKP